MTFLFIGCTVNGRMLLVAAPHTNRAPQGWPGYKMRSVEREGRSNHPDFPMMNERNPCKRVRCDPGFKCLPTLPREFVCVRNEVDASARMGEIIRNWQTRGIFGL
ncbi:hypothetical protein RvY_11004-2 [Ramazzottius varieornatus]|uniref:Uncharacterized protein n=1 Tax=Ramazzottius varieornatus TaxID=947166 RepID=A0A1D1VNL2_RAMVA|nr:hypothetical protein RvY_11004-2 [Ramazzottius varieornatus]